MDLSLVFLRYFCLAFSYITSFEASIRICFAIGSLVFHFHGLETVLSRLLYLVLAASRYRFRNLRKRGKELRPTVLLDAKLLFENPNFPRSIGIQIVLLHF